MFVRKMFVASTLAAAVIAPAFAQGISTPRIDQREANQQTRIANGIQSGSLTAREASNLERQQARIQDAENRAKADGVVTKQERRRINRMQNHADNAIYKKKHNRRDAN